MKCSKAELEAPGVAVAMDPTLTSLCTGSRRTALQSQNDHKEFRPSYRLVSKRPWFIVSAHVAMLFAGVPVTS